MRRATHLPVVFLLLRPTLPEVLIFSDPGGFEELDSFFNSPSCLDQDVSDSVKPGGCEIWDLGYIGVLYQPIRHHDCRGWLVREKWCVVGEKVGKKGVCCGSGRKRLVVRKEGKKNKREGQVRGASGGAATRS
jgi:hypothetical protein